MTMYQQDDMEYNYSTYYGNLVLTYDQLFSLIEEDGINLYFKDSYYIPQNKIYKNETYYILTDKNNAIQELIGAKITNDKGFSAIQW